MNSFQLFFGWFLCAGLFWLGLVGWSIIDRRRYDGLTQRLMALKEGLPAPDAAKSKANVWQQVVDAVLKTLSRRTLDRLARDLAQPGWLKDMVATHILARYGLCRLLREAAGGRWQGGPWRRIAALHVLYQARARGLHELLRMSVAEPDRDVTAAAVVLLGKLQDRQAARILIHALQRNLYAPSRIAMQLDQFPPIIADLLSPLLDDPLAHVRFWAISLLSRHRAVDQLDVHLAAHAQDPESSVRKAVVQAMGEIGGGYAVAVATRLLNDEVSFVRAQAARTLGKLFRPDAEFGRLVAPMLADRDWWVRLAAREALAAMGIAVWSDVAAQVSSQDSFARDGAREVLKQISVTHGAAAFKGCKVVDLSAAVDARAPANSDSSLERYQLRS